MTLPADTIGSHYYLSIYLSISLSLSIYLSISLSLSLFLCLSFFISLRVHISHQSWHFLKLAFSVIYIYIYNQFLQIALVLIKFFLSLSFSFSLTFLSFFLSLSLSIYQSIYLSQYPYLSAIALGISSRFTSIPAEPIYVSICWSTNERQSTSRIPTENLLMSSSILKQHFSVLLDCLYLMICWAASTFRYSRYFAGCCF